MFKSSHTNIDYSDILTPCNVQIPTSSSSATVKSSAGSRSICNPISPIYRLFSRQVISNHNNTMNLNENKEGTGIGKGPLTNTHLALLAIGFIIILGFGTSYACQLVKRWRRNKRVSTSREETVNHDASAIEFTGMCGRWIWAGIWFGAVWVGASARFWEDVFHKVNNS